MARVDERDEFGVWSPFPSIKKMAGYAYQEQCISLTDKMCGDVEQALSGDKAQAYHILPALFHEVRHWIDHSATLWGRRELRCFFEAASARMSDDRGELWRVIKHRRATRANRYEDYYSSFGGVDHTPGKKRRWRFALDSCDRFDPDGRPDAAHPITLASFQWSDDRFACKVPISAASLLETTALSWELFFSLLQLSISPPQLKAAEFPKFREDLFDRLYNPRLGQYSAPVHILSDVAGFDNIFEACYYASVLSSIALNMPEACFDALRLPDKLEGVAGAAELHQRAIQSRDLGYVFVNLVHCAPGRSGGSLSTASWVDLAWIEQTLSNANLPTFSAFEDLVRDEHQRTRALQTYPLHETLAQRLTDVHDLGDANFNTLGVSASPAVFLNKIQEIAFCPIVDDDFGMVFLGRKTPILNERAFGDWFDLATGVAHSMGVFYRACC